jgi:hypothetical protein
VLRESSLRVTTRLNTLGYCTTLHCVNQQTSEVDSDLPQPGRQDIPHDSCCCLVNSCRCTRQACTYRKLFEEDEVEVVPRAPSTKKKRRTAPGGSGEGCRAEHTPALPTWVGNGYPVRLAAHVT